MQSAHQRLLRLGGLPLPWPFKQRLLLAGIWPHALHAAETADVPRSVFGRLRTQAALAFGREKKGTNPFLACMFSCPSVVDHHFVLLCNRVVVKRVGGIQKPFSWAVEWTSVQIQRAYKANGPRTGVPWVVLVPWSEFRR